MKRIVSSIILIWLLVGMIAFVVKIEPVRAFSGWNHESITEQELKRLTFGSESIEKIINSNKRQDSGDSYKRPECHFDRQYWYNETTGRYEGETNRDAFIRARNYLLDQKELAKKCLRECHTLEALEALGRALHALQDFYSHSNYVDMLTPQEQDQARAALSDRTKDPPSGLWLTGYERCTSWIMQDGSRDPGQYPHGPGGDAKNKDIWTMPNFWKAYYAAKLHSMEFIDAIRRQLVAEGYAEKWEKFKDYKQTHESPKVYLDDWKCVMPGNTYLNLLYGDSGDAVNLTITQVLPNGVRFEFGSPDPVSKEEMEGGLTRIKWQFISDVPMGEVRIWYKINVTETALTNPTAPVRCAGPIPNHIIYYGEVLGIDVDGGEHWSVVGGDHFALIGIPATIDVYPHVLNLKTDDKWITGYIELPEACNISDISPSSLWIDHIVPIDLSAPIMVGDHDNDTIPDLKVSFNRTCLIEYLTAHDVSLGDVPLMLYGELASGTAFGGSVTISVSDLVGDVNCDGTVSIIDLVLVASSYASCPEDPKWNPNANFAYPLDKINLADLVTLAYHYGEHYP